MNVKQAHLRSRCFKPFRSNIIYKSVALLLASSLLNPSFAKDHDQALQALLTLLNEQTEIVTKTKLNADYVPGSLSVLYAASLQRSGVRTVADALSMSPSVEVQLNHLGQRTLVMRGMGTPFSGGMIKLMLDDLNMVSSSAGYAESILSMPIEQVERIEIIRGAASVLHGDFAYAGVVNVVSRQVNHFAVGAGSSGYGHASASQGFKSESGSTQLHLGFAQWQRDKTGIRVESDVLTMADPLIAGGALGLTNYSQAPGQLNDRQAYRSFLAKLKHHQTQLYLNALEYRTGDYVGVYEFMPKETQDYNQRFVDLAIGLRQQGDITSSLDYDWHLGIQQRSYDLKTLYTSANIPIPAIQAAYPKFASLRPVHNHVQEQVVNASGNLIYQPNSQHRILFGGEIEQHKITDAYIKDQTGLSVPSDRLGSKNDARNVLAVYIQDEWRPTSGFTLTMGLRAQKSWIEYYDISEKGLVNPFDNLEAVFITPKLAGVYQFNHRHILKAQYSQSVITPPIHQVVNVGAEPENKPFSSQTDHYELGYIYQGVRHVQRLTAFYSEYDNLPKGTVYYGYFSGKFGTAKFNAARTQGIEWDSEFNLTSRLNGFANLTWLDALDKANNKPIVGSAAQMAKLGLDYFVAGDWRLGLWLNYIGERNREPYDARGNLPAYMLTNFTANYSGAIKGLTISLGVENLADIDYRFPSPINGDLSDLNQTVGNSEYIAAYPEDYSGVGRQVWLKARYQF